MMIPVRCFTCGRVVGSAYEQFKVLVQQGQDPKAALDAVGLKRYCCRRMVVSQVDIIDDAAPYA